MIHLAQQYAIIKSNEMCRCDARTPNGLTHKGEFMSTLNFNPNCIVIPLTKGCNTIIDPEDADLADFKWYTRTDKRIGLYPIRNAITDKDGKRGTLFLHRAIAQRIVGRTLLSEERVDHIDGNGLNNTRANLRLATQSQNCMNRAVRIDNKSGLKGVRCKPSGKFGAEIWVNGKHLSLGLFNTPEAAHAAYNEAAKEHFGEFARIE